MQVWVGDFVVFILHVKSAVGFSVSCVRAESQARVPRFVLSTRATHQAAAAARLSWGSWMQKEPKGGRLR